MAISTFLPDRSLLPAGSGWPRPTLARYGPAARPPVLTVVSAALRPPPLSEPPKLGLSVLPGPLSLPTRGPSPCSTTSSRRLAPACLLSGTSSAFCLYEVFLTWGKTRTWTTQHTPPPPPTLPGAPTTLPVLPRACPAPLWSSCSPNLPAAAANPSYPAKAVGVSGDSPEGWPAAGGPECAHFLSSTHLPGTAGALPSRASGGCFLSPRWRRPPNAPAPTETAPATGISQAAGITGLSPNH